MVANALTAIALNHRRFAGMAQGALKLRHLKITSGLRQLTGDIANIICKDRRGNFAVASFFRHVGTLPKPQNAVTGYCVPRPSQLAFDHLANIQEGVRGLTETHRLSELGKLACKVVDVFADLTARRCDPLL